MARNSEVATSGSSLPANPADLMSGLANMGAVAPADASPGEKGAFMKGVDGVYTYGVDDLEQVRRRFQVW